MSQDVHTEESCDELVPGSRIDNYEIVSFVGEGGFGTVYKARDERLGRDLALKFLRGVHDGRRRKLFEREGKALAALGKHPSILQVYAWGEYESKTYLALEYVHTSAKDILHESPDGLNTAQAVQIVADSAEALEFAHKQGIIHRDVKPGNILIESDGRAKVADFGLARFFDADDKSASGIISGSPSYMSPEQADGLPIDHRTDIFSLGVTLYELLAGRKPFAGATALETIELIRNGSMTPLHTYRPEIPATVVRIVEKATAKRPADRYQSAKEMAADLRDALSVSKTITLSTSPAQSVPLDSNRKSEPVRKPRPGSMLVLVTVALCLAVASVVVLEHLRNVSGTKDSFAYADEKMQHAEFDAAATLYRQIISGNTSKSDGDRALCGLGYALILQGKLDAAAQSFGAIKDTSLRSESESALAYYMNDTDARKKLDKSIKSDRNGYPEILLAALDCGSGKYQTAYDRLQNLDADRLEFGWQQTQMRQILGQASYHTGDYDTATRMFDELKRSGSAAARSLAKVYSALIEDRADDHRTDIVRKQVKDIREQMDRQKYVPLDDRKLWTSRPVRFCILPVDQGRSRRATDSGLADVLPWMLEQQFVDKTSMVPVNRDIIGKVLTEQDISAYLSSGSNQLALGRMMGARLLIKCKFLSVLGKDSLIAQVVDTETSRTVVSEKIPLSHDFMPETFVETLAGKLWSSIRDAYPIRARLYVGQTGPEIDVGTTVGVSAGMKFSVYARPDVRYLVPDATVVVTDTPGGKTAKVVIEGFTATEIPDDGLFVMAQTDTGRPDRNAQT